LGGGGAGGDVRDNPQTEKPKNVKPKNVKIKIAERGRQTCFPFRRFICYICKEKIAQKGKRHTMTSMPEVLLVQAKPKLPVRRKVPDYLIREVVEGINFYYEGYRSVLNKTKTFEEIMADSLFQSTLKNEIGDFIKAHLDKKKYRVLVGETGLHISHRNYFGLDIAVYDKSVLTREKITDAYANVPAELVIEIDLNVETEDKQKDLFSDYVIPKTQRLLDFGTQKVVWYFSRTRKVMIAAPGAKWEFQDWSAPVEVMPGLSLDILQLMKEADISLGDAGKI
jgi:Uma2 family endonuclease